MAWIQLVEPDDAEGKLKELYDRAAQAGGGRIGPMIRAGSLNPDALEGRMKMYRGLMYGRTSSLNRDERKRAMVDYALKLTATPGLVVEDDIHALRKAGFDDVDIADINGVCAQFNLLNRISSGLGVEGKHALME